ncbi:hypothetical protein A3B21_01540 [Candidatus Uhrbacteria bacterium RIFCSPLOWO2_01_FULL_47_24]|uniref:POTRA domain-containing protein n=1 Tax=Candidatus Uhrbacteria bacterium RIFCSPLOWO2_01_FULL_47_24 TaxID=1802401 RepID=A0A1F7UTL7_9BACT|nr:MAG: hypothetical protein A2753_04640 [Candidatus Uhrbacteria bacterium RIFCSPHIGHO2_01_FULL_47_11]OGL68686.1 MAG: hypothetical protein A3D58_02150 [Candidatus Uhrbacteria bacterium RIFCSPHIGHO2_02_FULL_46_47]OGL74969.1 MAG: hypothetical protein A3F52_03170 [Candidatus Uhrbacteria bacterium RIFCSPHIGHO2_12_FULL_47_11]OGL81064.1 MAG: hypothetical protein A3B21_01540 [Candidatus Uhrbacteria bacterium RIFCSPLOWO2_01_FULL_47_24]OGL84583.1 MAG: hypothetical protein A3J03_02135 [Candidatus Uhrbact
MLRRSKSAIFRFHKSEKKNLGNPFRFHAAASPMHLPVWLSISLTALILSGGLYWLFFSTTFAIRQIRVDSKLYISSDTLAAQIKNQMAQFRWRIIPQRNIFAFNSEKFMQNISTEFALSNAYLKKDRPDTLFLTISDPPREALWSSKGIQYAIDAQGLIAGIITISAQNATILYDTSNSTPALKDQVVSTNLLHFVVVVLQDEMIKNLGPKFFIIEKANDTDIQLKLAEGWKAYFDTTGDPKTQLANLDLILRNTMPPDKRNKLDYIDLRFGEKVYYKYH